MIIKYPFEKRYDKILPTVRERKDKELPFELRFIKLTAARYIGSAAMHSIEHILAVLEKFTGGHCVFRTTAIAGFYSNTRNIDIESLKAAD